MATPVKVYLAVINALRDAVRLDATQPPFTVIDRFALPGTPNAPQMPYVCVPLEDDGAFDVVESRYVIATHAQTIVAFVPESESKVIETGSATTALKALADIIKAVMPKTSDEVLWNLGAPDSVEDVTLVSKDVFRGSSGQMKFVWVEVVVHITYKFTADELVAGGTE